MLFKPRELGIPIHGNLQRNVALVVGQPNIYQAPTYVLMYQVLGIQEGIRESNQIKQKTPVLMQLLSEVGEKNHNK